MIPITFNADDLNNEKKGNIRPQDLASYLSIGMTKRAGVLDIFENPCTAYQTNYFTGYATLTMHKGYINIYGRCIYVEEGEQVQVQLPNDNNTVTGVFGVRINLGETGANEVTWFTKTTALRQDDLLNNETGGIYEFALYNYTATSSNIQLTYIAPKIEFLTDYLNGANFTTKPNTDNTNSIATTAFVQSLISQEKVTGKKEQNGYIKFSNGLIVKWGFARTSSGSYFGVVNFDKTVPFTQVFAVLVTPFNDTTDDAWIQLKAYNTTQFGYRVDRDRTDCMYLAIGV